MGGILTMILTNNIHVWLGTNRQIMVSHENTKRLFSYDTTDDAINALYLSSNEDAARELNKKKELLK
jgi:hypothetical protein